MRDYKSAPLPFQGQKRRFINQFREIIKTRPGTVYVDLFGGSGLLSHNARQVIPAAEVIYNDYDHYTRRLEAIPPLIASLPICGVSWRI